MPNPYITVRLRQQALELVITELFNLGFPLIARILQHQLQEAMRADEFKVPGWDLG